MKNPFVFLFQATPKPLTRLTDINTEEVSIVDKAANKRRFAIVKSENSMNKPVDVEQFLEGLTNGLEKLTTITELVKAKVDKAEDATMQETVDFKTSIEAFLNEVNSSMSSIFSGKIDVKDADDQETGMDTEVAAQVVPGNANPAGDAAAGEAKVQADSVRSEVDGQLVEGAKGAGAVEGDAAGGEAKVSGDTVRTEVEGQTVTGTTELTNGTATPEETNSAGSVQVHKADPAAVAAISKAILDLASKIPTVEEIEKAYGMTEGLFFSGGINVDAYDIEALAAVVNALCEAMYDGDESEGAIQKSADRILAETSKRMVAISKRVTKSKEISVSDGKELKIVNMILKAVYDGMKPKAKDDKKKDKKSDKKDDKEKDKMKKDAVATKPLTIEDINSAVSEAVAKALAPVVAENKKLTEQVAVAKAETEKVVKDYNALNTTQTRVSSAETTTNTETESSVVHPNNLGISDYNAKAV